MLPHLWLLLQGAFPSITPPDVRASGFKQLPKRLLDQAMVVPGIAMILIGLTLTYAPLGSYLATNIAASCLSGYHPKPDSTVAV